MSLKNPLTQALREANTPNTIATPKLNIRMYAEHEPAVGIFTRRGTGEKMRRRRANRNTQREL